jgi:hypothetical protein
MAEGTFVQTHRHPDRRNLANLSTQNRFLTDDHRRVIWSPNSQFQTIELGDVLKNKNQNSVLFEAHHGPYQRVALRGLGGFHQGLVLGWHLKEDLEDDGRDDEAVLWPRRHARLREDEEVYGVLWQIAFR